MDFKECDNTTLTMTPEKNQEDPNVYETQDINHPPEIFPCISCESTFLKRDECREHMREHARCRTLKCRYCNEQQDSMKQLLHHLKAHRAEFSECSAPGNLQLARNNIIHNPRSLQKENKSLSTKKSDSLTSNTVIDRRKTERSTTIRGRKKGSYIYSRTCTDCGEVYMSTVTLKNHRKLHNTGKLLYSCSYCSYRSDFPAAIKKHLKKKHENLTMLYKCGLCKYVAIRISLLKTHVTLNKHFDT